GSARLSFWWLVTNPVTLASPANQNNIEGDVIRLPIQTSDFAGGSLRYTADGLPDGLTINETTSEITGRIAFGAAAAGPVFVTVTASDGPYSGSTSFWWNVTNPVAMTNPGDQQSTEGNSVALPLQATTTTGGSLSFSARDLPAGLNINPSTGEISGSPAPGSAGSYWVTVTATAGTYSASQSFDCEVTPAITLADPAHHSNLHSA